VWLIILQWNGFANTQACLRSLEAVDYPDLHILVLDNGSTDGSAEAVEAEFPAVTVVRLYANLLVATGRNVGLGLAMEGGADLIVFLDNDTEVAADFLDELLGAISANKVGIVGPKILYHDRRTRIWSAGTSIVWPLGWIHHLGIRKEDDGAFDTLRQVDALPGCCLAARREVVEAIGGFDADYVIYTEDTDWCTRAREAGWVSMLVPSARVYHRVSASSGGGLTRFKAYHRVFSTWRFFRKHGRWWHWPSLLLFVSAGTLAFTVFELRRGNRQGVGGLYRALLDIALGRSPRVRP